MQAMEAYAVLGLKIGADEKTIKRKYRQIMLEMHPDMEAYTEHNQEKRSSDYDISAVNEAYAVLMKGKQVIAREKRREQFREEESSSSKWSAPENPHAYAPREILHHVEDARGDQIGTICLAKGRYLWTPEEDFSLFLLSIFKCSQQILDEEAAKYHLYFADKSKFQGELSYLLSKQFIAATDTLKKIAKKEQGDSYYISSMLERGGCHAQVKPGEILHPMGMKDHRLYLCNKERQLVGYLSFRDDRFYYVVVPLFEQKLARVKIIVSGQKAADRGSYQPLDLWIRLTDQIPSSPENINLQIEEVLAKFRKSVDL